MSSDGLTRQNVVVGVSTALTALSVVIVSLRIYTRTFIVRNIGKDDYAMLAAMVFTLAYLATIFVLRSNGMGFSGKVLKLDQMTNLIKTVVAVEVFYYLCVNAVKVSIVFFYLRIAAEKTFERLCKFTTYFLSTFCLVCIIVCLTQCIPLHKMWDLTGLVQGTCINTTAFFYMTSATNIALDIWIIVLPVKVLLNIHRPAREKLALVAIFALGTFSCIASISSDPFYDNVPINTWSMVEINLGIYCASIPSLKALFSKAQRQRTQNTNGYQYHGSGRSGLSDKKTGALGPIGTIVKNEEFVMKTVRHDDTDVQVREHAAGHWSPSTSQERIVNPRDRV
ncbi:Nn.00g052960.m01.CDS01 [Neocucurbitaria sp. VM-36]